MEEMRDTEFCRNCLQNISVNNYRIHSVHCERNIQLCNICNEAVPRKEMEQHLESTHSVDACELCDIKMEKWLLENHKNECPKRLVLCKFCDLESPFDVLDEHLTACGSRTEKCGKCKTFVKLSDKDRHLASCQKQNVLDKAVLCQYCGNNFPLSLYLEHIDLCEFHIEQCFMCNTAVLRKDRELHQYTCKKQNILDKVVHCKNCGKEFPLSLYSEHIDLCELQTEQSNKAVWRKDRELHQYTCKKDNGSEDILFCEYCKEPFTSISYPEHISVCESRTEKCLKCNSLVRRKDKCLHPAVCSKGNASERLCCQYCGESYPTYLYNQHIDVCESKRETCHKCNSTIAKKDGEFHHHKCQIGGISESSIPCEYCGEKFPAYLYIVHVDTCSTQYETCHKCNANIFKRDKQRHDYKCHKGNSSEKLCESQTERCEKCNSFVRREDKYSHQAVCGKSNKLLGECSICHELVPWINMNIHETICQVFEDNACASNEQDFKPEYNAAWCSNAIHKNKETKTRGNFVDNESIKKLKMCPYCYERFPDLIATTHMESCEQRPFHCELCMEEIPFKKKSDHLSNECKFTQSGEYGYAATAAPTISTKFEKTAIERNMQTCPFCSKELSFSKLNDHTMQCPKKLKQCSHCNRLYNHNNEQTHFQCCPALLEDVETPANRNSGCKKKKRNKNKNLKQKEPEPVKESSWFSNLSWSRKPDPKQVKDYSAGLHDVIQLPCEFCEKLFFPMVLIEHQTGCRPDLTSCPKREAEREIVKETRTHLEIGKTKISDESNFSLGTGEMSIKTSVNQGALPKRNRVFPASPDVAPGEFLGEYNQAGTFSYFSSVEIIKGKRLQTSQRNFKSSDEVKEGKHVSNYEDKHSNTTLFNYKTLPGEFLEDPDHLKKAEIASVEDINHSKAIHISPPNFKDCFMKTKDHQSVANCANEDIRNSFFNKTHHSKLLDHVDQSNKYPDKESANAFEANDTCAANESYAKNVNKAIGTERAEKREIWSHSSHSELELGSSPNKTQNTNPSYSQFSNSSTKQSKFMNGNQSSSTLLFNIQGAEKVEKRRSFKMSDSLEDLLNEEYDLKNEETFGTPNSLKKSQVKIEEIETLSDFEDSFFDAEENIKFPPDSPELNSNFLNKDTNLDSYFSFLKKDVDKVTESRNVQIEELPGGTPFCNCDNEICYCSVINRTTFHDNSLSSAGKTFEENSLQNVTSTQGLNDSEQMDKQIRSNNLNCNKSYNSKSCYLSNMPNCGIDINSPAWTKWVNKKNCDTDSD